MQEGGEPIAADMYRAATVLYARIRTALQHALEGELAKFQLIERRMRAAGLQLPQPSPVARWRVRWAAAMGEGSQQRILPEDPWPNVLSRVPMLAPRFDWAPPATPPPNTLNVYVASVDGRTWAITVVAHGDCQRDGSAALVLDAGGPVVTDLASPLYEGETAGGGHIGVWTAVSGALRLIVEGRFGRVPIALRVRIDDAAAVAGMTIDSLEARAPQSMRAWWRRATESNEIWLAGFREGCGYWWGDRAIEVARHLSRHQGPYIWGEVSPGWTIFQRLTQLEGAGDACPVCLEDFSDCLPRPAQPRARLPGAFYECKHPTHMTCIGCDRTIASSMNTRCSICRAGRCDWVALP